MEEFKKEYFDMVPDFHGEPESLSNFLQVSEELISRFYNAANPAEFKNIYIIRTIIAKIKGPAAKLVHTNVISTWEGLKNCLVSAYSDKRDSHSLTLEISKLHQKESESPIEFHGRVQSLLNLQISYYKMHNPTKADTLADNAHHFALRVLLHGLRDPIGPLMRTKNPRDLNTALSMITNDFQFFDKNNFMHQKPKNIPIGQPTKAIQFPRNNFNPQFNFKPRFPQHYYNNQNPQQHYNNQNNHQRFPPRNPQIFYQRPQQQVQNYNPTPMSISTTSTRPPFRTPYKKFNGQPVTGPSYPSGVTIEEVNNIDCNDATEQPPNVSEEIQYEYPQNTTEHSQPNDYFLDQTNLQENIS